MDTHSGPLLGTLRCSLRVCLCTVMCEGGRGGRLEAKINGTVFGCIPEEHLHQSQRLCCFSQECVCLCVCMCGCVSIHAEPCAEPCVLDTGKIESTEELPYHQFTVPAFVFNVHVCVCLYVCVRSAMSAMYMRCFCFQICVLYFHQDNSSSLSVLEGLKSLLSI